MSECRTVSVIIPHPLEQVYDYLSSPANIPEWSLFIHKMRPDGESWIAETTNGTVAMRFTARNTFGVLDHDVIVSAHLTVHVPMRVVAHGPEACAVLFTIFRLPGMSDAEYEADVAMVEVDMENLRGTLEG